MSSVKKESFVKLTPQINTFKDGKLTMNVEFAYGYLNTQPDEKGITESYIPDFDIYFFAGSKDQLETMSLIAIKSFAQHYVTKEDGFHVFLGKLKNLGFEPGGGVLDWRILRKNTLFKDPIIFKKRREKDILPEAFNGASSIHVHEKLELSY